LRQVCQGRREVELLRACLAAAQGHTLSTAERVVPGTRHGIPTAVQYAIEIQRDHGPSAPRRKVSLEMHGPSADTAAKQTAGQRPRSSVRGAEVQASR